MIIVHSLRKEDDNNDEWAVNDMYLFLESSNGII